MTRQIEMHWCCATCARDNLGRDLSCAQCGKPREQEEYLMPGDTASAPSVTDSALLNQATAGPNWSCKYCRSSQRRLDGSCARCGAPAAEGADLQGSFPPVSSASVDDPVPALRPRWLSRRKATVLAGVAVVALLLWVLFVPHPERVSVQAVSWHHAVEIERYQIVPEDGWDPPADAIRPASVGERVHHYDHRIVGFHMEYYTVQVACGQTCTPIPRSCYESCSSNKNGFATCRTSCSGGGESCSTRYCSEGRSRSVNDYQDFPIYRTYYAWTAWRWKHQRDAALSGATTQTAWPRQGTDEHLNEHLAVGEQEREGQRSATYAVTFVGSAGSAENWHVTPKTEAEFRKHALGSTWQIEVDRMGIVHSEVQK